MSVDERASIAELYRPLDDAEVSGFHWLTVLTAGMGFFTDAYDLFIIGTVTALLTPIWHLSTGQLSLLNSVSLFASVFGAVVFGKLMDRLGRKSMYGVEVIMLTVGALLCALAWNFWALFAFRILVGIGVGGDYSTSAVITAEYANRKDRGRLISLVFAMQGFGLLAGPAIASLLLAVHLPTALTWRLMLGLGAIPAASVIYLRRKIRETPRYTLAVQGDRGGAVETVRWATGSSLETERLAAPATGRATASQSLPARLTSQPFLRRLVGTAGSWFLMDIAFYGNSISSPLILEALQPHGSLLSHTLITGTIFLVAAVPGYWVAVRLMDKLGRKRIQWQGFLFMALAFAAIAFIPGLAANPWAFLVLFAISYFFIEFGPNVTTFVYPAEIFPTTVRGTGDGISAAGGKVGAFLGALVVPTLLKSMGLSGVMGIMAAVSAVGILLTLIALPEPNGQTLETASFELGGLSRHAPDSTPA